jgi:hypothetical protein
MDTASTVDPLRHGTRQFSTAQLRSSLREVGGLDDYLLSVTWTLHRSAAIATFCAGFTGFASFERDALQDKSRLWNR